MGVVCNLPTSNLSPSDFKLAKWAILENFDVFMPVAPFLFHDKTNLVQLLLDPCTTGVL